MVLGINEKIKYNMASQHRGRGNPNPPKLKEKQLSDAAGKGGKKQPTGSLMVEDVQSITTEKAILSPDMRHAASETCFPFRMFTIYWFSCEG